MNLIYQCLVGNKEKCLDLLQTSELCMPREGECISLKYSSSQQLVSLSSNQEEADTKVILHAVHTLNKYSSKHIIIRSPSGDTYVLVLAVSLTEEEGRPASDQGII